MATSATDAAGSFYVDFLVRVQAITNDITGLATLTEDNSNTSILDSNINKARLDISQLERSINAATLYLPLYDQRQCWSRVRELTQLLDQQKNALQPRQRFAFRRRTKAAVSESISEKSVDDTNTLPENIVDALQAAVPVTVKKSVCELKGQSIIISHWTNENPMLTFSTTLTDAAFQTPDLVISTMSNSTIYFSYPTTATTNYPSSTMSSTYTSSGNCVRMFTAAHIDNVRNCKIILLPLIQGSILLENIHDSILVIACRQFRMHKSTNIRVLLSVMSDPIIEDCSGINVSPLVYEPPIAPSVEAGRELLTRAGHDVQENRWQYVKDFNWLKNGQQSPNWTKSELSTEEQQRLFGKGEIKESY